MPCGLPPRESAEGGAVSQRGTLLAHPPGLERRQGQVEGKDYVVSDGEIMSIRFNV